MTKRRGGRRLARELALQALYAAEIGLCDPVEALQATAEERSASDSVHAFALELVQGVLSKIPELDGIIGQAASNWDVGRLAAVDRQIVRLGTYELLFRNDIPTKVSINEAIELAKIYGSEESGAFVNGVLDAVAERTKRP